MPKPKASAAKVARPSTAVAVTMAAITEAMKLAAAEALAAVVAGELAPDRVIPSPFDPRVAPAVTAAVAAAARAEGVARR